MIRHPGVVSQFPSHLGRNTKSGTYRSVLTHGFVVDGKGEKMAKSKGNVIAPEKVINAYGVGEVLRLWVASEDYREDIRISDEILNRLSRIISKDQKHLPFSSWETSMTLIPAATRSSQQIREIDRWAFHKLYQLTH